MKLRQIAIRTTLALAAGLALLTATAVTASAAPAAAPARAAAVPAAAWSCGSGNLCVWRSNNGTGVPCMWSNADPDWQNGSVRCSWSATTKVQSYYNAGTSNSYVGVCLYSGANYTGFFYFAPQHDTTGWTISGGGTFLRSHRWVVHNCVDG